MKRRQMLAAIAAAAAAPAALAAEASGAPKKVWPKVPEGWYGEGMYQDLAKDGTGVTAPGTEGLPTAYIAFDPQCPWCEKLHRAATPLYSKVRIIWCPVAVLNINSEPQGSMILSASDPWKSMRTTSMTPRSAACPLIRKRCGSCRKRSARRSGQTPRSSAGTVPARSRSAFSGPRRVSTARFTPA